MDKLALSRNLVISSYLLLLLELLFSTWWLIIPLLLFVWPLKQQHWRGHIWLCFMLMFYFLLNINSMAVGITAQKLLQGGLIVILFTSAMLWCRWSKQPVSHESTHGDNTKPPHEKPDQPD